MDAAQIAIEWLAPLWDELLLAELMQPDQAAQEAQRLLRARPELAPLQDRLADAIVVEAARRMARLAPEDG